MRDWSAALCGDSGTIEENEREKASRDVCVILRTRENGFGFCSRLFACPRNRDLTFLSLLNVSFFETNNKNNNKQAEFKFEKFLSLLPETESRYAVLDWDVTTDDGREFSKLFFISWVPDSCKAKEKNVMPASSKQSLHSVKRVHLDHQATDMDDVTEEVFTSKALGK